MTKQHSVYLSTRNVGVHFATIGRLETARGRVIWESEALPYGFTGAALDRARTYADSRGWTARER